MNCRSTAFIVVLAVISALAGAGGQSVPELAVEVTAGGGPHTLQTSHTYYSADLTTFLRLGATFRLGPSGNLRPVLLVEYATGCFWPGCGNPDLNCFVAPDGSCRQFMNDPRGVALGVGISGAWRRTLATVAIGDAGYSSQAQFLDASLGVDIIRHLMFIADARYIVSHDKRGDWTWFFPRSFGLRLH